jgi:hypothetical protein
VPCRTEALAEAARGGPQRPHHTETPFEWDGEYSDTTGKSFGDNQNIPRNFSIPSNPEPSFNSLPSKQT